MKGDENNNNNNKIQKEKKTSQYTKLNLWNKYNSIQYIHINTYIWFPLIGKLKTFNDITMIIWYNDIMNIKIMDKYDDDDDIICIGWIQLK